MEAFWSIRLPQKYVITTCDGLNKRTHYSGLYKAMLQDYSIPLAERQEICIRTNHIYLAFFRQHTASNYYKEFFKREQSKHHAKVCDDWTEKQVWLSIYKITDLIDWAKPKDYGFKETKKATFNSIVDAKHENFSSTDKNLWNENVRKNILLNLHDKRQTCTPTWI